MLNINPSPLSRGCVTAIFEDGPQSFILAKGARLAGLARRLAMLLRQRNGKLLDITVEFETRRRPGANNLRRGYIKQQRSAR